MRMLGACFGLLALATAAGAGCGSDDLGQDVGYEKWNAANNPSYVDPNFKYNVADLPVTGEAKQPPIPADYWATYKDNINVRWDGSSSDSPAAKYGKAFGVDKLEDIISKNYGIEKYRSSRKSCKTDSDCSSLKDGSTCARRQGESSTVAGVCIPTWWGICHGWAPYAISEPAAVKSVEHNGVTFYPGDLEGLMSLVYGQAGDLHVKFLSERCNEEAPKPGDDGRIPDDECRDMNPGSLHIVVTNLLGLRSQGFVEDRTYDLQVWNQPVKGFRVENLKNGKLTEVTKTQAIKLVGLTGSTYTYNRDAKRFFHVKMALDWVSEAPPAHESHVGDDYYTNTDRYEYILEADKKGNIQGGEYVGESKTFHPDFFWWPTSKPGSSVANGKISYANVAMLNEKAKEGGAGGAGGAQPTGTCAHSVCETGAKLVASCSPCATKICGADKYCCDTEWDQICVDAARKEATCGCQ